MTDYVRYHVSANKMVICDDLNKNIYMLVQLPRYCFVQLIRDANRSHSDA